MRVLDRKLVRELQQAQALLLLIASIIAVGVTCYVAMQSAYLNLEEAKRLYYRQCRMADFWIDLKKAPDAELQGLLRIRGISEVRSRIQFQTTVELEDVTEPVNGLVLSLPDRRQALVNDVVLQQGGYFSGRSRYEVLVNEKFARAHRLYPGQHIRLLMNNRRLDLLIVGTAISSEFTYLVGPGALVPDPRHFGIFYVTRSFAEEVFDFEGAANQVVGRVAPGRHGQLEEILLRAERQLAPFGVITSFPLERQMSNEFLSGEIEGLGGMAAVLPAIFLAVAALVLNVLVSRLARRQRTVVGTLKALGYADQQIFVHFLMFAMSVGVMGGLFGSFLGYLSATGMTYAYRWYFEFPDLRSGFYWNTNAIGMVVSITCSIAGGMHAARRMLRLQAAESMRPEPPRQGGTIWLERVMGSTWQRLSSGWKMALRSLARHRVRTTTGVFAAMMGAALLVCGFMMTEAQSYLVKFQFYRQARSDVNLTFKDEQSRGALAELRALPGVDYVEPMLSVAGTFRHGAYRRKGAITGLVAGSRLTVPYDQNGQPLRIPSAGLILTRRLADSLRVTMGSKVTLVPARGERRPVESTVVFVADSYMGMAAYADVRYLSRLVDESFAISGSQLVVDQDADSLARLYRELKRMPNIQSVQSRRDMIRNLEATLLQNQYVFIGVLGLFAGVIFFGSIVNGSMVALAERQREVASLCALGYSNWQVGGMFFRESFLTTLCGTLLGMPVGYGLTWLTAVSYNSDIIRLPVVSAPWVWWTTLLTACTFAVLAHLVVQWTIERMKILEALKVSE